MLGKAPNSPEMQAAAKAEILRQQQIQQAQSAIQQQQAAEQQRRAAAKPAAAASAAKPATTASAATTPQETVVSLQPAANIQVQASKELQELNKNMVYYTQPKEKTGNPVLDAINTNFNLDNTAISYGQAQKATAERVRQTGNVVEQAIASAYLRNDDPKAVGSAAWYEETVGKALSGGRLNLNEKIETGNPVADTLANFGRGVLQVPSSFSRMVTAAGLSAVGVARELSKGNIGIVGQTVASGTVNAAAGTVRAAVEDPAAFAGNVAGGIILSGGLKAVTPKIRGIKATTSTTPEITIKNRTVIIETPGKKITTAGIKKTTITKNSITTGKATTVEVKSKTGFAAVTKGKTHDGTTTGKTGKIDLFTKKYGVTIKNETRINNTGTVENAELISKNGAVQQTKYTKGTEKTGNLSITGHKIEGTVHKARGTRIRKSESTTNIKISQTANGKTRTAVQRTRTSKRRKTTFKDTMKGLGIDGIDTEILKDTKTTRRTAKAKADKIETDERLLPGEVKKTPTITIKRGTDTITIIGENNSRRIGTIVDTKVKATAGEKTATATKEVFRDEKGTITKRNVTMTNSKNNTAKSRGKVKEQATTAKQQQKAAAKKVKETARKAYRENSEKALELSYLSRAHEIKIRNLIKQYGWKKGIEEAIKRGYIIQTGKNTKPAQLPAPKEKPTTQTRSTEPQQKPKDQGTQRRNGSGGGLLMKEKPAGQKTQQKTKTASGGEGKVLPGKPPEKPQVKPKVTGVTIKFRQSKTAQKPVFATGHKPQDRTTTGNGQVLIVKPKPKDQGTPEPETKPTTQDLLITTPDTTQTRPDTETKDRKLVVIPIVIPRTPQTTTPDQKQRRKQKVKTIPITRQTNKKRLLIKDEEWKKKKSKKAPKKGKNAVRLETVNQFGWLGFDAKPPAKPKLLKLQ